MSTLGHDLRYAARAVVKTPVFTATAVITLALCIGALTTIFSFVNGLLLEPTDPAVLVSVSLVLLGVALVAAVIPARRASRVDPITVLR